MKDGTEQNAPLIPQFTCLESPPSVLGLVSQEEDDRFGIRPHNRLVTLRLKGPVCTKFDGFSFFLSQTQEELV